MDPYDVIGLTLEEATEKLNRLDINPNAVETAPLRAQNVQEGILRVVKVTNEDENWTLTLCKVPDIYR